MNIGKQPFNLPINNNKSETSIIDKVIIKSHDEENLPTFWEFELDRRKHTQNVKIKFYIVGYRDIINNNHINLIGRWIELEPFEIDFFYPLETIFTSTYRIGFYPYINNDKLIIRLQLIPYPLSSILGELYIEKVTIIDSDFDSESSWFNDNDLKYPIVPQIDSPDPPTPNPKGIDPDPNCTYPF